MMLFSRSRFIATVVGLIGASACGIAATASDSRPAFFNAYLYAYLFWLGISLGSLSLILLHNLTGGEWGHVIRRIADPAARLLPLLAILFIPILFGMHELFPWSRSSEVATNELLRHREVYLNVPFFVVRALIYFGAWIATGMIVRSAQSKNVKGWSAAGLILYLMTMTHAGYDWAMSRDTDFYSTAFGFIVTVGQTLSALAFALLVVWLVSKAPRLAVMELLYRKPEQNPPEFGAPNILNDVGNILLTLVILWAYVSFMQFLVIWMGNSGEDNGYYLKRGLGQPNAWRWIGLALITVHFFIPFFLLLFRATKMYLRALTTVAAVLFLAHLLEQYWLIAPSPDSNGPHFALTWLDCVMPFAIGGIWIAAYLTLLPSSLAMIGVSRADFSPTTSGTPIQEGPHNV